MEDIFGWILAAFIIGLGAKVLWVVACFGWNLI